MSKIAKQIPHFVINKKVAAFEKDSSLRY